MKTTKEQVLLYDDNCPLCAAYTSAFIKTGFLQKESRIAFSAVQIQQYPIDKNRARHEIPLIDIPTGNVLYGIDALAAILNQQLPFIAPLLKIRSIKWLFKKLYSFISYNRKIIVAAPANTAAGFDCSPDYSFKHRYCLALVTWVVCGMLQLGVVNNYFPTVPFLGFISWMLIPFYLILHKSKQEAVDILVHSAITMLLSTIIFLFFIKLFSWLFTYSLLGIVVASLAATYTIVVQTKRRIKFTKNEYTA